MAETGSTTGTLGVLNAELALGVQGLASVGVQLTVNGGWNGTVVFEATMARGGVPVWFAVPLDNVASRASVSSTTLAGNFIGDVSAFSQFRCRCSVYVAGIATLTIQGSAV